MYKILDGCYDNNNVISFLKYSNQNRIVITEQLLTETFKAGSTVQVEKAFSCFKGFESQVLLTKATPVVLSITPAKKGLRKRYIDNKETKRFRELLEKLNWEPVTNLDLDDFIVNNAPVAHDKLLPYKKLAEDIIENSGYLVDEFSPSELRQLRSKQGASYSAVKKILNKFLELASESYLQWAKRPSNQVMHYDLFFSFHYRWALCTYLNLVFRIKHGSLGSLKQDTIVNDLIDMEQAAWATIYDGIISNDGNLNDIFNIASWIVRLIQSKAIYKS